MTIIALVKMDGEGRGAMKPLMIVLLTHANTEELVL